VNKLGRAKKITLNSFYCISYINRRIKGSEELISLEDNRSVSKSIRILVHGGMQAKHLYVLRILRMFKF
jgi:hypothetical protein